ncbi:MAG: hypothetical protein R2761_23605 [Acidimicrobiales bacterium]
MSDNISSALASAKVIASSKVTIASVTTTSFDFGTPDDINLAASANYPHGARIMVVLSASTGGTTDSLTWVVQDAPDSSGSIGSPATAVTSVISGALAAGTGDDRTVLAVQLQPGRPWLRVRVTSDGANDTFVCHATVLAIPAGV